MNPAAAFLIGTLGWVVFTVVIHFFAGTSWLGSAGMALFVHFVQAALIDSEDRAEERELEKTATDACTGLESAAGRGA